MAWEPERSSHSAGSERSRSPQRRAAPRPGNRRASSHGSIVIILSQQTENSLDIEIRLPALSLAEEKPLAWKTMFRLPSSPVNPSAELAAFTASKTESHVRDGSIRFSALAIANKCARPVGIQSFNAPCLWHRIFQQR